jgi:hypothetical protein
MFQVYQVEPDGGHIGLNPSQNFQQKVLGFVGHHVALSGIVPCGSASDICARQLVQVIAPSLHQLCVAELILPLGVNAADRGRRYVG